MSFTPCEPCCNPSASARGQDSFRQAQITVLCQILTQLQTGGTSGTQYANDTIVPVPVGTVALGWDGTEVKALSTDSAGVLNVNVVAGGGDVAGTGLSNTINGAAGGITTVGVLALNNPGGNIRSLYGLNKTDVDVLISFDNGTTYTIPALSNNGTFAIDFSTNGRIAADNIRVKSLGSNSSSGNFYIGALV